MRRKSVLRRDAVGSRAEPSPAKVGRSAFGTLSAIRMGTHLELLLHDLRHHFQHFNRLCRLVSLLDVKPIRDLRLRLGRRDLQTMLFLVRFDLIILDDVVDVAKARIAQTVL